MVVGGSGGNVDVGGSGGNHGVCLEEERRQPTNGWQPRDSSYIININNTNNVYTDLQPQQPGRYLPTFSRQLVASSTLIHRGRSGDDRGATEVKSPRYR